MHINVLHSASPCIMKGYANYSNEQQIMHLHGKTFLLSLEEQISSLWIQVNTV